MQDLKVTLVQTELAWQDPAANRDHFASLVRQIEGSPDLVVLPEMFTTGFTMEAEHHAERMTGESVAWMAGHARERGVTLCGSLVIEVDGRYFNRLIWMPPDGRLEFYDKRHLFRMADEQRHYSAGRARRIFRLGDWRVCPLVCYDLRFPVWSRGVDEFDLLIYVANWPATRRSAWRVLLPARAVENLCYVVGVNRIGQDGNGRTYVGDSVVVDHLGATLLDQGARHRVDTVALDGDKLLRYRRKFPAHLDADEFRISAGDFES